MKKLAVVFVTLVLILGIFMSCSKSPVEKFWEKIEKYSVWMGFNQYTHEMLSDYHPPYAVVFNTLGSYHYHLKSSNEKEVKHYFWLRDSLDSPMRGYVVTKNDSGVVVEEYKQDIPDSVLYSSAIGLLENSRVDFKAHFQKIHTEIMSDIILLQIDRARNKPVMVKESIARDLLDDFDKAQESYMMDLLSFQRRKEK